MGKGGEEALDKTRASLSSFTPHSPHSSACAILRPLNLNMWGRNLHQTMYIINRISIPSEIPRRPNSQSLIPKSVVLFLTLHVLPQYAPQLLLAPHVHPCSLILAARNLRYLHTIQEQTAARHKNRAWACRPSNPRKCTSTQPATAPANHSMGSRVWRSIQDPAGLE